MKHREASTDRGEPARGDRCSRRALPGRTQESHWTPETPHVNRPWSGPQRSFRGTGLAVASGLGGPADLCSGVDRSVLTGGSGVIFCQGRSLFVAQIDR